MRFDFTHTDTQKALIEDLADITAAVSAIVRADPSYLSEHELNGAGLLLDGVSNTLRQMANNRPTHNQIA
ncbi:MAG: hypothetical protein HQL54_06480 [Magnetococcales bacterium]|nr:hypothetical protein [Magnetococcales bacterium]